MKPRHQPGSPKQVSPNHATNDPDSAKHASLCRDSLNELSAGQPPVSAPPRDSVAVDSPAVVEAVSADDAPPSRADADLLPVIASVSPAEAMGLSLSPPQRTAIQMLTSGRTAIDSALAAGVSRRTLYRWLKTDANFQAAYNAWQHDAIATARGKVLALTDAAVDAVRRALIKGDTKTALVILKSIGILDRPDPGSTDPEELKAREEIARERSETNLFFQKLEAKFPE